MRPDPSPPPLGLGAAGLALITVGLWGGNPVAMKYSLTGFPVIAIAAMRFGLAALFMLLWCRVSGNSVLLRRDQWLTAFVTGFLLFAQISLFNLGVKYSSTSHTTVIINTFIFWVVVIEHFVTRNHQLSGRAVLGLLCAAAGVLLLTASRSEGQADQPTLLGDSILMLSAFVLGVKIVYTKRAVRTVAPGTLILWHDVIGVAFFILVSLIFERGEPWRLRPEAVLGLVYQGVFVAGVLRASGGAAQAALRIADLGLQLCNAAGRRHPVRRAARRPPFALAARRRSARRVRHLARQSPGPQNERE